MPKPRRHSGAEVVAFFESAGFVRVGQEGTHVKIRRVANGRRQTLVVPLHRELDTGTCRAILRQASDFMPDRTLHAFFYTQD
jgi:predicted RNA binding protein YcfA (HicA-like mRNA interferase family)